MSADIDVPGWRRPTLSFTLLSLIVALLMVTVGAIVGVGGISQALSIEDLESRLARSATVLLGVAVGGNLASGPPVVQEAQDLVLRGRLDVDDATALDDFLVERLRYQPAMAWFSYSDQASGRFRGAWRREDGAIIINTSDPQVDGGRPVEFEVAPDGRRTRFEREVPEGYDPRRRDWYTRALARDGVAWSEPYEFTPGRTGLTAALALRQSATGEARGVFTADFLLEDISRHLGELTRGRLRARDWLYAVVSRGGQAVASASGAGAEPSAVVLAAALGAMPADLQAVPIERPVPFAFDVGDVTYYAQLQAFPVASGLELIVVAAVPQDKVLEVVYENQRIAVSVGLVLVLLSIVVGALLARRIARPLWLIANDLEKVGRFEISSEPAPRSFVRETVVVSDAVDRMKASLRSFGRYVPRQLVQDVLASGQEAQLGGQDRRLTIYFSDIEGFTRVSESMEPGQLVEHLGEYLAAMTTIIQAQQGTVDKFIGDGILALFGAPRDVPDHAAEACRAALRSQACLRDLADVWRGRGKPVLRARIGLHTGEVIVGNIGTPDRFEFTVIGDAVNLASRLEGLNKVYGTRILASQDLRVAAGPGFEWRTLDRVAVVGRTGGTPVSELIGERGRAAPAVLRARDEYERALEAYFARDFARAAEGFRAASAARPGDPAAAVLARRAEDLRREPPPADWDGVFRATSK